MTKRITAGFARRPEVSDLSGLSKSGVYDRVKNDPTFPQPIKLGRITVWRRDEIIAWVDERTAAARTGK